PATDRLVVRAGGRRQRQRLFPRHRHAAGSSTGGTAIGQVSIVFDGSEWASVNLPNGRTATIVRWRF
ncbi:hypothetical protein WAC31_28880, partial [Klebsiella pneumoniae]|uniref:hypothetical protein n=1 Tax=Klebsiella pneumoniae TaxID=573 RepID=UPI003012F229